MDGISGNEKFQEEMDEQVGNHEEHYGEEEVVNEEDIDEVIDCGHDQDEAQMDDNEEGTDEEMAELEEQSEPPVDNSIQRFTKHQEPVFCLATHPRNPEICASGGADDLGYIWNISTGEEIFKLEGHQDSLSAIEFSPDGQYLATGGVDATIKIWKNLDPQSFSKWEFLLNLEASEEVTVRAFFIKIKSDLPLFISSLIAVFISPAFQPPKWLTWHPKLAVILAGFSDGMIYMWQSS